MKWDYPSGEPSIEDLMPNIMARSAQPPGRSVLIVEDEQPVAALVEEMLRDLGYADIRHAATIEAALAGIDRNRPDIVVLDASIRGLPAYQVAQRLRDDGIPFVVSTGFDPEGLPKQFRFGVPLRKPYALADLEAALAKAASSSP